MMRFDGFSRVFRLPCCGLWVTRVHTDMDTCIDIVPMVCTIHAQRCCAGSMTSKNRSIYTTILRMARTSRHHTSQDARPSASEPSPCNSTVQGSFCAKFVNTFTRCSKVCSQGSRGGRQQHRTQEQQPRHALTHVHVHVHVVARTHATASATPTAAPCMYSW